MAETKNNKRYEGLLLRMVKYLRENVFISIISVLFAAIATILILTIFNHQLNPDASSYFTIAQKYAHGDVKHAINGYWGPLLSWLLVPAVWLGVSLPIAGKFVLVLTAVVLLWVVHDYFRSRGINKWVSGFVLVALSLLLLEWSVVDAIAPDLLIALFTVMFAVQLSNFVAKPSPKAGMRIGLTGALMYFSKGFGFFLFIGIIALVMFWQWWMQDARNLMTTIRRYASMVGVFTLFTLPFVAVISIKYHTPTVNNAGAYNHYVTSPTNQTIQPIEYMGPLPLPNNSAVSAWEDPTIFTHLLPDWNPISSHTNLGYFFNNILYQNITKTVDYIYGLGPLVCAGVVVLFMGTVQRKKQHRDFIIFSAITVVTFAAYAIVFVMSRYLWASAILGLLALGLWLDVMIDKKAIDIRQTIVGGVLICSVMALTIGNYVGDSKDPDIEWYKSAMSLQHIVPKHSGVISDNFNHSLHPCYYLQLKCYNVIAPPPAGKQQTYYTSLKDMGVTYYINYHTRDSDKDLQAFVDTYFVKIDSHVTERVPITTYKIK